MIDAAIFDMDGVLIDSVPSTYRVKSKVLKEDYGIDITLVPDPHGEAHKGGSLITIIAAVKKYNGVEIDESTFIPKVVAGIYQDLQDRGVKADPNLVKFLEELKAHGVAIAVATSATRESTENKLRILGIKDFFRVIITTDDITEHKPHPESYIVAMERLHVLPAKSFVFEDSVQGVEAGRGAGAKVIGVTNYNSDKTSLHGTALNIDNWTQMNYQKLLSLLV